MRRKAPAAVLCALLACALAIVPSAGSAVSTSVSIGVGFRPEVGNPFFRLAPEWAITPLAVLATMATVIASQALISGAFSLTAQAVQLDYLPRVQILHTSRSHRGQIYVPLVNWLLMIGCVGLVLGFRSSSNLAAAYGIAVTATMAITTLLFNFGKFLIGYYLGKSNVASSYGAAASIITILLWIYYSSLILLFGAEFTKAYAESRGSRRGRRTAEP